MKKVFIFFICLIFSESSFSKNPEQINPMPYSIVRAQVSINGNNSSTWVWNTGVFNQDLRTNSTPGFEWPKGTGKFAIFTTGLSMGAYINDSLRLATVSYNGEYAPGYISGNAGVTNTTFKLYRVVRGDNGSTNPDYANWGLMIPYGAPFDDLNNNGIYEQGLDKPGMKNAAQTVFICLTDAFPENHISSEGFSGGTRPVMAEMHLTAWCYDNPGLEDAQFVKMEVINKNILPWNKTFFGIVCDPDLGEAGDDYIGCDTVRNMGFCYNATNVDGTGSGKSYGQNPPAVGVDMLKGAINRSVQPVKDIYMSSFAAMINLNSGGLACETDPGIPIRAYNFLRGMKRDSTPVINASTMQFTKYCFSGDPETMVGWSEFVGKVNNCNGATTGTVIASTPGDRRFIQGSGGNNLTVQPGEKQTFMIAQFVARGANNKNAVTKLRTLSDNIQSFYNLNLLIDVKSISSAIPERFSLLQNYPNPFNPETKIKFELPQSDFIKLAVFDINGKQIEELINQKISAGTYEVNFSAKNLSSGIYFCRLSSSNYVETKKMSLIK